MIAGIRFVGEIWSSYREIPWEFRIWGGVRKREGLHVD